MLTQSQLEQMMLTYVDNKIKKTVSLTDETLLREVSFNQIISKKGGKVVMKLRTRYMENLPSPSYKTKQFERTIETEIPDNAENVKELLLNEAKKHQTFLEALVKNDIARHINEANK